MESCVRKSCESFLCHADCLSTTQKDEIPAFLSTIDQTHYEKILKLEKAQMSFPLSFSTTREKWNFYSILHLLNFGSGFRVVLKIANGAGAFDNIIKLLMAAHISGDKLTSTWMSEVERGTVAGYMRIDLLREEPVPESPILRRLVPSDASVLVDKITLALNETGRALRRLGGYEYLIDYVRHVADSSKHVDDLLEGLSQLSVLDDKVTLQDGTKVYVYKKMQVMISELVRNGFEISCIGPGDLTVFADNVIPTMLHHYGLIQCPSADIALRSDLEITPLQALSLRAASVVICRDIVNHAQNNGLTWIGSEIDLDNYLWKVAKEGDLRKLPRYADRSTWFY